MPENERDYDKIRWYIIKYAPAPQVIPLLRIRGEYTGEERSLKYKLYIDNLINTGQLDLMDVNRKEKGV